MASAGSGMKQIAHVDMDAFFVSVEQLYRPELQGQPVIVGGYGDERGVVAAASYEARKFGVHSAMPLRTAKRLCPQAIFLPGNHERYEEWSEKIRVILENYTPVVQMVSIDEAYLDLTGTERLHGSPWATAAKIQRQIAAETALPCSLGVAQTYLVAKVASDLAKPRGLLWVLPGAEAAFLAPLPLRRIPGIGKVTGKALAALGVSTVGELARLDRAKLEELFGQWGEALYRKARGQDADLWFVEEEQKSVSNERTFSHDVAALTELDATLSYLAQLVGKRLRELNLYARTITLKLRYANFETLTRALTLEEPTNLDAVIYETAYALFDRHWQRARAVRLLGIALSTLTPVPEQLSLLDAARRERLEKLARATDRVRDRFGFDILKTAKSLLRKIK